MSDDISIRLATVEAELRHVDEAVKDLTLEVRRLTAQANKWRGGFGVLLLAGGFVGWLASRLGERWAGGG